jgi:hypothetical protein
VGAVDAAEAAIGRDLRRNADGHADDHGADDNRAADRRPEPPLLVDRLLGLGNRDMLSNEECDDCNQTYSASDNELVAGIRKAMAA